MISINMTEAAKHWGKTGYFDVQVWCIDNIGEMNNGWDSSYSYDPSGDRRLIFLFDNDKDATMFALRWMK